MDFSVFRIRTYRVSHREKEDHEAFWLPLGRIIAGLKSATVVLYHVGALQLWFFLFFPPFFSTLSKPYATRKLV